MTSQPWSLSPAADAEEPRPRLEQPARTVAYALLRSRRLLAATSCAGALLGLASGLMRPNVYRSTGTLLLRSGVRETESAEAAVAGRDPQDAQVLDVIGNEVAILSHRDTFRRLMEKVGVGRILDVYDPSAEDTAATSWLARGLHQLQTWWFASSSARVVAASPARRQHLALETLQKNLQLSASGSSLIHVGYEAHTPQLAKEVTDAFLAAAEEQHRQVFSNRTSLEFLKTVAAQARTAAREATDALMKFKQEHGIYDLELQRTGLMSDIGKLEAQVAKDAEELQVHEGRSAALRQLLAAEQPFDELVTTTPARENPEYGALQQQLFALRTQETTIRGSMVDVPEMERRVQPLLELIAGVERRLQAVPPTLAGASSRQTAKNLRYERLRGQLDDDELAAATLRAAHGRCVAELARLRRCLVALEEVGPRCASLQEEVARHEGDHKRLVDSLSKMELLNLLDEHKLCNLQILEAGDLPLQKSGPNRGLITLAGLALGFACGACLALVRHRCDGFLRRTLDLQAAGAGVLGVVPALKPAAALQLGRGAAAGELRPAQRRRMELAWGALVRSWMPRGGRSTIALVGDEHAPGVTTLSLHFAARSARRLHREVLLVETNYCRPQLAGRLGVEGAPGFADFVGGAASREEIVRPTRVAGLRVVCAGAAAAAARGIRAGRRPEELLRSLIEGFPFVLLDVPSVVEHPVFGRLLWCADVVVPVFAAGRSTKDGARELLDAIAAAGKDVTGALLNCWVPVRPFWLPKSLDL